MRFVKLLSKCIGYDNAHCIGHRRGMARRAKRRSSKRMRGHLGKELARAGDPQ